MATLNYYHDWYKDYFYAEDMGRKYYYHVEAYDSSGKLIALSEPPWVAWKVKEAPTAGIMLTPTAYRRLPLYDTAYSQASRLLPINLDLNNPPKRDPALWYLRLKNIE